MSSTATSILVLAACAGGGLALGIRFFPSRDSVPPLASWTSRVVFTAAVLVGGAYAFNLGNELKHLSSFEQGANFDRGTIIAGEISGLALRVAPLIAAAMFIELFARGRIEPTEPLQSASRGWDDPDDEPTR